MDYENNPAGQQVETMMPAALPIGPEQLQKFTQILEKYKSGKAVTERRIVASENWWKLRNTAEEQKETQIGKDGSFTSKSGWLHNVIVSKHADAMESFPEPICCPESRAMWKKHSDCLTLFPAFWNKTSLKRPTAMPCGRKPRPALALIR